MEYSQRCTYYVESGVVDVVLKKIINVSAFDIILANEDADSEVQNRIIVPGGADLTLGPDESTGLFYDVISSRWRVIT